MKKIPWFKMSEGNLSELNATKELLYLWEYVAAYFWAQEQSIRESWKTYLNDDNISHSDMVWGINGKECPLGPWTVLNEYCRVFGFQTEDNLFYCPKCFERKQHQNDKMVCPVCGG